MGCVRQLSCVDCKQSNGQAVLDDYHQTADLLSITVQGLAEDIETGCINYSTEKLSILPLIDAPFSSLCPGLYSFILPCDPDFPQLQIKSCRASEDIEIREMNIKWSIKKLRKKRPCSRFMLWASPCI